MSTLQSEILSLAVQLLGSAEGAGSPPGCWTEFIREARSLGTRKMAGRVILITDAGCGMYRVFEADQEGLKVGEIFKLDIARFVESEHWLDDQVRIERIPVSPVPPVRQEEPAPVRA